MITGHFQKLYIRLLVRKVRVFRKNKLHYGQIMVWWCLCTVVLVYLTFFSSLLLRTYPLSLSFLLSLTRSFWIQRFYFSSQFLWWTCGVPVRLIFSFSISVWWEVFVQLQHFIFGSIVEVIVGKRDLDYYRDR